MVPADEEESSCIMKCLLLAESRTVTGQARESNTEPDLMGDDSDGM